MNGDHLLFLEITRTKDYIVTLEVLIDDLAHDGELVVQDVCFEVQTHVDHGHRFFVRKPIFVVRIRLKMVKTSRVKITC